MDRDLLIKSHADIFAFKIDNCEYEGVGQGDSLFKYHLDNKLDNYHDNLDKLIFLNQLKRHTKSKIEVHKEKCSFRGEGNCPTEVYLETIHYYLDQKVKQLNPEHEYRLIMPHINSVLINENLVELTDYEGAASNYQKAIDKLSQSKLSRNLLDDLRLSLELLLKDILENNKSLEKQKAPLGEYLQKYKVSTEVRNMFTILLIYYKDYQNENVKHNDNVKEEEIALIFNLTSTFISFLINIKQ